MENKMYQLLIDYRGQPAQCVKIPAENKYIPFDPDNTDYQKYLEWLEEGNTPLPADEPNERTE